MSHLRSLRALIQKADSMVCESWLRVHTRGIAKCDFVDGRGYEALPYKVIRHVLARLEMTPEDSFLDVGCGKGRALCSAARLPIRRAVGVEIQPELLEIAKENADLLRGKQTPIELHMQSAEDFDYSGVNVIYMFNPFGPSTMRSVLRRIDATRTRNGGPLCLAYINPSHDDEWRDCGWLQEYDEWEATRYAGWQKRVSFWRSRD